MSRKRIASASSVVLVASIAQSAFALSGSGDSAPGNLDTQAPHVYQLSRPAPGQVGVIYSEAMMASGADTAANYAVGGTGAGTLAATPDSVTGGPTTWVLVWNAGQQVFGQSVEVTVTGVIRDVAGNQMAIDGTANEQFSSALPVTVDSFTVE